MKLMPYAVIEITPGKPDKHCPKCNGTGGDKHGLWCSCTVAGSTSVTRKPVESDSREIIVES